jgi:hypothetical protein
MGVVLLSRVGNSVAGADGYGSMFRPDSITYLCACGNIEETDKIGSEDGCSSSASRASEEAKD